MVSAGTASAIAMDRLCMVKRKTARSDDTKVSTHYYQFQRPSDLAQTKGGQCKSSKVPENLLKRQNSARGRWWHFSQLKVDICLELFLVTLTFFKACFWGLGNVFLSLINFLRSLRSLACLIESWSLIRWCTGFNYFCKHKCIKLSIHFRCYKDQKAPW